MDFEKIYEIIAQKHGVSVQEVKEEMGAALKMGWQKEPKNPSMEKKQKELFPGDEVPDVEEFVRCMAHQILKEKEQQ